MLHAKTVMKKDVVTIAPETPLDLVIDMLIQRNITGIPVVNDDRTIAGMITEKDILNFLLTQDVFDLTNNRLLCETTAYHIMTTNVVSYNEETDLVDICKGLVNHHFRRVPITDADGELVGILSRNDIIAVIS